MNWKMLYNELNSITSFRVSLDVLFISLKRNSITRRVENRRVFLMILLTNVFFNGFSFCQSFTMHHPTHFSIMFSSLLC